MKRKKRNGSLVAVENIGPFSLYCHPEYCHQSGWRQPTLPEDHPYL